MRRARFGAGLCVASLLAACVAPLQQHPVSGERLSPAPEAASGFAHKQGWTGEKFMVATANPLATEAGFRILKAGGSATDAAIAVQMVLTLVEPQSSGIGGGAFLLHFDGKNLKAFDGRETAPAAADESLFFDANGRTLDFYESVVSGRSVGVPGVLRMLELAHRQYGRLPWKSLFAPAIELCEQGFPVSPRLLKLLQSDRHLKKDATAAAYFYDASGQPWPIGYRLKNPQLAIVLRAIAEGGADVFYQGRIARDIVAKVRQHPVNPGRLNLADMAGYQAKVREPVCGNYRAWIVCGMPPPSSGGIAIAQMLGILEHKDMAAVAPVDVVPQPLAVHWFAEAGRLAYADRARYVADTDFVPLPGNSVQPLLDPAYLARRAALIGERSMGVAPAGEPFAAQAAWGGDASPELPATSHVAIVDDRGNAVSMTTSIENSFGSRQMVDGFLLNNQLTDFSFAGTDANGPVANRIQPGKRPRSAMAPTMVFDRETKSLRLIVGSPGGSGIINYVAKVLVASLDWGMNLQDAINLPNFGSRNGPTELEQGRAVSDLVDALKARGHDIRVMEQTSGVQGIMRVVRDGHALWFAGADPRREGDAKGE